MSPDVPVAFLIFNRPDCTRQVFQQITAARPKRLFVVADGPRSPAEETLCRQARAIVEQVDWDCDVLTNFSDGNMGCRRRVSSGLDWVFQQCDEAIILEDDCVPHPDFFSFCGQMLSRYRNDERIMMVGGMNYLPGGLAVPESYVFSRYFAVWGWATWRRAWDKYDPAMADWTSLRAQRRLQSLYLQNGLRRYLGLLFDTAAAADSWAIRWAYSCVFQNGLSIVPSVNLVSNVGTVGTHARGADDHHYLPTSALPADTLVHPHLVFPNALYDDALARGVLLPLVPSPARQAIGGARRDVVRRLREIRDHWLSEPSVPRSHGIGC